MHTSNSYLTGQFLIAMPALPDPNFSRTVSYICQHSDQGAMGLVINRPLDIDLEEILKHMDIEISQESARRQPVYLGGPVQPERGFVLHSPIGEWDSSLRVNDELAVTTSLDILRAIANGEGPMNPWCAWATPAGVRANWSARSWKIPGSTALRSPDPVPRRRRSTLESGRRRPRGGSVPAFRRGRTRLR